MTYQQHTPPHPGELIFRTYIEPFEEITGNNVADRLGVARSTFNRLINGVSDVSPEMAVRLSSVLGGTAESWLTLQESYDLWEARQAVDTKILKRIDFNKVA
ncbi:MAG: HigA family addiction module antidote protein [Bacteroidetes bacterium]|nr:HigA family addiction module antidote protein [Bacteroidota bacterium]